MRSPFQTALLSVLCWSFATVAGASPVKNLLREGDLIFQQSQSSQAAALEEATGSTWTHVGIVIQENGEWLVAEASSTVSKTPIERFIRRGKHNRFVIRRIKDDVRRLEASDIDTMKDRLQNYYSKPYDIYFEWNNELIYCSELTSKVFQEAFGLTVGKKQKMRDMKLDGPHVTDLIIKRYGQAGKTLNLDEPIVTPVAVFESESLRTVFDSKH